MKEDSKKNNLIIYYLNLFDLSKRESNLCIIRLYLISNALYTQ
jgi:hypothetical protein